MDPRMGPGTHPGFGSEAGPVMTTKMGPYFCTAQHVAPCRVVQIFCVGVALRRVAVAHRGGCCGGALGHAVTFVDRHDRGAAAGDIAANHIFPPDTGTGTKVRLARGKVRGKRERNGARR